MRKLVNALVLLPLTLVLVMLLVANRQGVTLSIDPFSSTAPAFAVTVPLFLVIILTLIAGAILGGIAAWLRQGKWRRAARRSAAELRQLRAEMDTLQKRIGAVEGASAELAAPSRVAAGYSGPPTE